MIDELIDIYRPQESVKDTDGNETYPDPELIAINVEASVQNKKSQEKAVSNPSIVGKMETEPWMIYVFDTSFDVHMADIIHTLTSNMNYKVLTAYCPQRDHWELLCEQIL